MACLLSVGLRSTTLFQQSFGLRRRMSVMESKISAKGARVEPTKKFFV
jgi:hypothetical protein